MYHYQLVSRIRVAKVAQGSWAVQMNLLVHKMKVVMLTNVLTSPPVR